MKKIILILFVGIFLISLAGSAKPSLGVFKQGDCVNLVQICDTCTYNNISWIELPNRSISASNVSMGRDDTMYNYSFCDTKTLGEYTVNGFGDIDEVKTIWAYKFEITPTGKILKTSDSITYIILTAVAVLLFLFCLYGGIVLPFRNRRNERGIISVDKIKYFKVGLLFLSYVLFVWILNLLFTLSINFSILTQYTAFFEIMFVIMNAMSYPMFVFMLILMSILAWKDLQLKKLLQRGFSP